MAQATAGSTQTVEWLKCDADAAYFLDAYGWIDDPQGDGSSSAVRFRLWPAQTRTMWQFMQHRLVIILKARQLGISQLCCGYALWLCLFRPGRAVLCFSKGQTEANELIRRIKALYDRLPDWLRAQLPTLTRPLTSELEWSNGSRIQSLPATQNAGRSFTASLVLMDEAAFSQWAATLYTALKPTIDAGGQLIVFSTANGADPFFQPLWDKAIAGVGGFLPIFLPWHARPGRDAVWYATTERDAISSAAMKQEYPCLTPNTLVSTKRGIIRLEDARIGDETESGLVMNVHVTPPLPVYKLTTYCGRELTGTAEHPIATPEGFIPLSSLMPGDKIVLCPPRFAEAPHTLDWNDPPMVSHWIEITADVARFLGYFAGDGSWHKGEMSFMCDAKDMDVVEDVARLIECLLGTRPIPREIQRVQGRRGAVELRAGVTSSRVALECIGVVANGRTEKARTEGKWMYRRVVCVPECIKRSPREIVREFLRGLFEADGSVTPQGMVRLGLRWVDVLRDVQLLLLGFGINSRIVANPRKSGSGHMYEEYMLVLNIAASQLFHKHIGFTGQRKNDILTTGANRVTNTGRRSVNVLEDVVVSVEPAGESVTYNLSVG